MEKAEVTSLATKIVREASPSPIRGGQLSAQLKIQIPDFDPKSFGCRNLREFIRNNAPAITEEGRAGTDIIYAFRQQQQTLFDSTPAAVPSSQSHSVSAPLRQLLTNPHIWKTFANPNSSFRLFLLSDGKIRVVRPSEVPEKAWNEIHPVSPEVMLQIAKDFVASLPMENHRGALEATLNDPKWWLPFFDIVGNLGIKSRWVSYRRRRIAEAFEAAILALPASVPPEEEIAPPEPAPHHGASQQAIEIQTKNADALVRRIAVHAVQRMTEAELRSLILPLGYVMDALGS